MTVALRRHRLTVEAYHKMGEAGVLAEDEPVEIIEGEIIDMAPVGSAHAACVRYLLQAFASQRGDRALLDIQNPLCSMTIRNPSLI